MVDPEQVGASEADWREATVRCHELRVARVIEETHDSRSIVLEIPEALKRDFEYEAGQFLSFKIPLDGGVLVRSYSLASSPHAESVHKVTVKRVEGGRISNWLNDHLRTGDTLMVVPPAGRFVLGRESRGIVLFAGGSGITPVISIIKSALASTDRPVRLVYSNRDERSIIFRAELDALVEHHPERFQVTYLLDDTDGFITPDIVRQHAAGDLARDFYMCGPDPFMDLVERTLHDLGADGPGQIHIERFISPHDPATTAPPVEVATDAIPDGTPDSITVVLDGAAHEVPYEEGETVLAAARRAGLAPPFSCEEGYCSCCMAKLAAGDVKMAVNDCLTPDLLKEGWVLTCQSRCQSRKIRIEYPD